MKRALLIALLIPASSFGQLSVDGTGRTPQQISDALDSSVRLTARNIALMTKGSRRTVGSPNLPLTVPMRVTVANPPVKQSLYQPLGTSIPGLTFVFDSSGSRSFPTTYQATLQSVLTSSISTINTVFGAPSRGATIHIRNFDADFGDRDALAGGYYVENNGSGESEIRLPVYNANETAAVNLVHCILLAYLGPKAYTYDAFTEGLVRAAVMKIVATPGALPNTLNQSAIDQIIDQGYDVGGAYDILNQRTLAGPTFIAPNLRSTALPDSGSTGGIFLTRYKMAGSAWLKVLTEYPAFASTFNSAYYGSSIGAGDVTGLKGLGQAVLNTLGGSNSTVEGLTFSNWYQQQFALDPTLVYGTKVFCDPVPITTGLQGSDFGVFAVQIQYFSTDTVGNETLLSGKSYPVFWDPNFNRLTPGGLGEAIDIAGAYGSTTPNFPDQFAGQNYRVAVDIPVSDQLATVFLPAGSIATTGLPAPKNFFGTVTNVTPPSGTNVVVDVTYPGATSTVSVPVQNGAFGTTINDANYIKATLVTVTVKTVTGSTITPVLTRRVNKSTGDLWLDLRPGAAVDYSVPNGIPAGISLIGIPVASYSSDAPALLSTTSSNLLLARFNASKAAYEAFPKVESPLQGHGYFTRRDTALGSFVLSGRRMTRFPASVALRPGWNMISSPLTETVSLSRVQVTSAASNPVVWGSAVGDTVGTDIFEFVPGSNDAASGVPETGSMNPVSTFEPNKGYFVRCLAPEGAILTFFPASPLTGPYLAQTAAPGRSWQIRVELTDGSKSVSAHLGTSSSARTDLDWRVNSELPPGIGGLQIASKRSLRLYRDVRKTTTTLQTYTIQLEGLTAGRYYELRFPIEKGFLTKMQLINGTKVRSIGSSTRYGFTATGSSQLMQVRLQGVAL